MIGVLIDHLWESTLFALAAGTATLAFRNNGAHVRYWLWFAASAKFMIPFALLAAVGRYFRPANIFIVTPEPVVVVMDVLATPLAFDSIPADSNALAVLWACGFAIAAALWAVKWIRIQRVLRAATTLDLDLPVPVKANTTLIEPGLVGIFRPVLLLPMGATKHLSDQELRAILVHELCHLRRRDNLTAAIHILIQTAFWFYPLLWWIGTRLVAERERACDEAVLKSGTTPETYAESILKVCKLYVQLPVICAAGVSGANLAQRIEGIMMNRKIEAVGAIKSLVVAVAAITVIAGPIVIGWMPAHGQTAAVPGRASTAASTAYELPHLIVSTTDDQNRTHYLKLRPFLDTNGQRMDNAIAEGFEEQFRKLNLGEPTNGLTALRARLLERADMAVPSGRAKGLMTVRVSVIPADRFFH